MKEARALLHQISLIPQPGGWGRAALSAACTRIAFAASSSSASAYGAGTTANCHAGEAPVHVGRRRRAKVRIKDWH